MKPSQTLRRTWAEINLSALASNYRQLRSLLKPQAFFCPMVKANAYGHGDVQVARVFEAEGTSHVGVSLVEEGVKLRSEGIRCGILVFGNFSDEYSAVACLKNELTPVISSFAQLKVLKQVAARESITFHLKFDTGMSRLGFFVDDAPQIKSELEQLSSWKLEGICTHLYKGEDSALEGGHSDQQLKRLAKAVSEFLDRDFCVHALNSAGIVALGVKTGSHSLGGRPGIALYGAQSVSDNVIQLQNVMTLKSHVVAIKRLQPGQTVSYNATWSAQRPTLLGVVPIGYADGVPRRLSNQFSVLCRGKRVPAVGMVCMDYLMVDLTDLESELLVPAKPLVEGLVKDMAKDTAKDTAKDMASGLGSSLGEGEEIVFFGRQGTAEISALEWAQILGTIPYEIFTSISNRVPREYVST